MLSQELVEALTAKGFKHGRIMLHVDAVRSPGSEGTSPTINRMFPVQHHPTSTLYDRFLSFNVTLEPIDIGTRH